MKRASKIKKDTGNNNLLDYFSSSSSNIKEEENRVRRVKKRRSMLPEENINPAARKANKDVVSISEVIKQEEDKHALKENASEGLDDVNEVAPIIKNEETEEEQGIKRVDEIFPDENDPNFFCKVCRRDFVIRAAYHRHLWQVHEIIAEAPGQQQRFLNPDVLPNEDDPNYYCQTCEKLYQTKKSFDYHIKHVHRMKLKSEILKSFIANSSKLPDEDDPNFYCRVCVKSFSVKRSYRNHLQRIHKMVLKPLPKVLQKTLIAMQPDLEPDPHDPNFYCKVCQKNLSAKNTYLRHLKITHNMKKKLDEKLGRIKALHPELLPDEDDPNFFCRSCEKYLSNKCSYRSHLEVIHSMTLNYSDAKYVGGKIVKTEVPLDENDPSFKCQVCNIQYKSRRSYRKHLRSIHLMTLTPSSIARRIANPHVLPDKDDPNNFCQVCQKSFARHVSYRYHLTTLHNMVLDPISPNRCSYINANANISLDQNDPNFYCGRCEKHFKSRSTFRNHLTTVHELLLKPLVKKRSNRIIHAELVPDLEDPNFACCACEKSYGSRSTYRKHLRGTHRMKLEPLRKNLIVKKSDELLLEIEAQENIYQQQH